MAEGCGRFLMEKNCGILGALESPQRPFVAIWAPDLTDRGIENRWKVPSMIGGAMMLRSQSGEEHGKSLCKSMADLRELLARAQSRISLPLDAVAGRGIDDEASAHIVPSGEIPEGEMGLDIGP
jgi:phosphoglycerate kinase